MLIELFRRNSSCTKAISNEENIKRQQYHQFHYRHQQAKCEMPMLNEKTLKKLKEKQRFLRQRKEIHIH